MNPKDFLFTIESAGDRFDIDITKIEYYMESVHMLQDIQKAESRLKVESEDGTLSDLMMLEAVVTDEYVSKMEAAVNKSMKAFSDYADKVSSSFTKEFNNPKTKAALEDAKKSMNVNRILKKQDVEVIDSTPVIKMINKYIDKNTSIMSKVKSGIATKEDLDKADALMSAYDRDMTIIKKNGLTTTEKLSKVFKTLLKNMIDLPKVLEKAEKENAEFSAKVLVPIVRAKKTGKNTEVGSLGTKCLSNDSIFHKDLIDAFVKEISSQFSVVNVSMKGADKVEDETQDVKTESVDLEDSFDIGEELCTMYEEVLAEMTESNDDLEDDDLFEEETDSTAVDTDKIEKEMDDAMKKLDDSKDTSMNESEEVEGEVTTESAQRAPAIKSRGMKAYLSREGLKNVVKTKEGEAMASDVLRYIISEDPIVVTKSGVSNKTKTDISSHMDDYKSQNEKKVKEERAIYKYVIGICDQYAKDMYSDAVQAYQEAIDTAVEENDASSLDVMEKDLAKGAEGIVKTTVKFDDSVAKALHAMVKSAKSKVKVVEESVEEDNDFFDMDTYFDGFESLLDKLS